MKFISRREFLKISGMTAGVLLLPFDGALVAQARESSPSESKGMLVDLSWCVGCGWCQQACKQWNGLSAEVEGGQPFATLSAQTWSAVEFKETQENGRLHRIFVKRQCMHCLHPACVSACPVGALRKTEHGAVVYDVTRCIGCRYCMVACPFGVPKFEWEKPLPLIRKCTFCADRQETGLEPACAEACPTGALFFGERDALIAEAEARIREQPGQYVNHIYGRDELGGTAWIYLSPVSFASLDFPALKPEPVTRLSETVAAYGTPSVALSVASLLVVLYYRFSRQEQNAETQESSHQKESEKEP